MLAIQARSPLQFLITIISFLPVATATCYWQNSTLAPNDPYSIARDDVACFPNQQNSPCCGTGWSCLSDGVCYIKQGNNGFYYRGTCTDRTWNSQQCPGWCFAQNSNTSIPLINCKKSTGEDWYCCPGDPECNCTDGKNALKLGATPPVTVTVIGSTTWPGMQSTTSSATTATSSMTSVTTTSASPASATTTGTAVSSSNLSGDTHPVLPIALGVGIGVAILLLLGIAFFFWQRARKRRAAAATASAFEQHSGESSPFMHGNHRRHISTPGEGYYATQIINEKDGNRAYPTQELDAHGVRSHEFGYIDVKRTSSTAARNKSGMVEMDTSPRGGSRAETTDGRVELA